MNDPTLRQFVRDLAEDSREANDLAAFRRRLLERASHGIGCDVATVLPPLEDQPVPENVVSLDWQPRLVERYIENRKRYHALLDRFADALARDGAAVDVDVYSRAEWSRHPATIEVLEPAGVNSQLCMPLAFRNRVSCVLVLARCGSSRPFCARDLEPCREIVLLAGMADAAVSARHKQAIGDRLSVREQEVAALLCEGLQNKEIAGVLGTSPETVRKQSIAVYRKLDVPGRVALTARYQGAFGAVAARARGSAGPPGGKGAS